jgi:hypothetical protein
MDAMYLAGMVADGAKLTSAQLNDWLDRAEGLQMVSEYTIPWLTVENPQARALALKWMKSKKEHVAAAGWCTYGGLLALKPDAELDLAEVEDLLNNVVKQVHKAPNRVRQTMNLYVISVGGYIKPLLAKAKAAARQIGEVTVDMGETACKVPDALSYIEKIEARGSVGKKRKTMRC